MSRPIIGITGQLEAARWGMWVREAVLSPVSYARCVEQAGGAPVVLPPLPPGSASSLVAGLDGLLLAGGPDVDPVLYEELPHEATDSPDHRRDRFELALIRAAIEADLPFLAICRGLHVLNVARGGTLIQHLPDKVGHDLHRPDPVKLLPHDIQLSAESRLGRLLGTRIAPPSGHHQAINRVGSGLLEVGWAAQDQVVEAVELAGHRFGIGVQWHPEAGDDHRPIAALVEAASAAGSSAASSRSSAAPAPATSPASPATSPASPATSPAPASSPASIASSAVPSRPAPEGNGGSRQPAVQTAPADTAKRRRGRSRG
jgi:putative glutamine amidotransferase